MTMAYHEILLATADELARAPKPQKALIARLREAAATLEKVPEAKREKVAMALRVMEPRLVVLPDVGFVKHYDFARWGQYDKEPLSEAYPKAPLEIQARLVLGEKTTAVTGGLTAKEAHEYLSDPPPMGSRSNPASWLLARAELSYPDEQTRTHTGVNIKQLRLRIDSVPLARWLIDRWKDAAQRDVLIKERVERGPHGEEVRGRFIDRVDELKDADLRPSVRDTFMAAGQRMATELEKELKKAHKQEPLAPTPHWWRSVRCATLLDRPKLIAAEGAEMKHCVANYVPYVRQQRSVLVSLRVRDKLGMLHRSTVEINRQTLEVFQHRGIGNKNPHPLNERALEVCLRRWREARDKRLGVRPAGGPAPAGMLRELAEREGNPVADEMVVGFVETPDGKLHMLPPARGERGTP